MVKTKKCITRNGKRYCRELTTYARKSEAKAVAERLRKKDKLAVVVAYTPKIGQHFTVGQASRYRVYTRNK